MTVFNSLYSEYYDQLYAEKNYQSECDLVEEAFARHATGRPKALLDIGCGTGGHSIELARRDYNITGVDLSEHMLERARTKAASLASSQAPTWLHGDARTFAAGQEFDAAIMMFAVVGYLTSNQDVLVAMKNIRRHLSPGAVFVTDFWYGPSVLSLKPGDRVRTIATSAGQVIRATNTTLDIVQHTADVRFKLWTIENNTLVSETSELHRLRYFFPQEFAFFLSQAGFELKSISAFPSLDTPLNDQTWNALAVAKAC